MSEKAPKNQWFVVIGAGLALIVGNGPIMLFTFGVFLKPITNELGWHRGVVASAVAVLHIATAIATPFVGKLIDRHGVRCVTLPFIAFFSISTAAISLTTTHPWSFIMLFALCGLAGSGQSPVPYAKAISATFGARRGLALGIAMAGVGLGAALMPQAARLLILELGWRFAYIGLGILTFAFAFPVVALFVHVPPNLSPNREGEPFTMLQESQVAGVTLREALTDSWTFWSIGFALFLTAVAVNGTIAHIVPILTDRGTSAQLATSMLSVSGFALIAGRIVSGYFLDRIFAPYVAACSFALPVIGVILLSTGSYGLVPLGAAVCLGLGLGAEIDIMAFLVGRYFGLRTFGQIYGYLMALFLLGSGLGPWLMGVCFDETRSYNLGLASSSVALVLASLLILGLGPYPYSESPVKLPSNASSAAAGAGSILSGSRRMKSQP